MNQLNPSLPLHRNIGILLGGWALLFSWFVRPFEHGTMDQAKWVKVSLGYSLLVFLSYLLTSWLQKKVYEKRGSWNLRWELGMYGAFYGLFTLSTFAYYRTPLVNGYYDIFTYLREIVFIVILVLTPILIVARRYAQSLIPQKIDPVSIILTGENKRDRLQLLPSELVCVSNAQNYVEVYYLEGHTLKKKLIRTSLKKLQTEVDFLLRIHRSHLINPAHFKSWKDANTISLTQIDLPVSKTYKKNLENL